MLSFLAEKEEEEEKEQRKQSTNLDHLVKVSYRILNPFSPRLFYLQNINENKPCKMCICIYVRCIYIICHEYYYNIFIFSFSFFTFGAPRAESLGANQNMLVYKCEAQFKMTLLRERIELNFPFA